MKKLRFNIPIMESVRNEKQEFKIKGVAINSVITRNQVYYSPEELELAAESLGNVPILKDHNNSVDSIIGRTINSFFDGASESIFFEGRITDEKMQLMIERGDITAVSVGATVQETKKQKNGIIQVKGITFVELSLVAVPADPNAGLSHSIMEAYEEELPKEVVEETIEVLDNEPEAPTYKIHIN